MAVLAAAAIAAVAESFFYYVASYALQYAVSSYLSKKPSTPSLSQSAFDRSLTVRQPAASARVIYGEVLTGGIFVFLHASDTLGAQLTDEDYVIPATAPYTATAQQAATFIADVGASTVLVRNVGGAEGHDEEFLTALTKVASSPAAGQYSVAAGVYTFNAADAGKAVRISYRRTVVSVAHERLHAVIELAVHECEAIGDIYFDDEVVALDGSGNATGKFAGAVYVSKHLGSDDQAADATLMAECPSLWTSAHRLRGRAYLYVRMFSSPRLFPSGMPNIRALVKGKKVYDPRTGLTAWSANAALCMADYLVNTRFGLGHVYASEIDATLLTTAANVCDQAVALAAGGTEKRYTCNGMFDTSWLPKDILGRMKVAMAGHCVRIGGKWKLYAGAYLAPTITLTEDDARGAIQLRPRVSRRSLFNRVRGVFVSPENNWQAADFPVVTNATYLAEDLNDEVWLDIDLPFTTSKATAQRLAKIELERVRQQQTVVMPCKLRGYLVEPPQTVLLTIAQFGYAAKAFEVIESRLVTERDANGAPYLGVDLTLRETASTVFDWNSGEETTRDPAPDTNLPNPFIVRAPGVPSVTEALYETRDSRGVGSKAIVTWSPAPDGQVRRYDLQWKLKTAAQWSADTMLTDTRAEVLDLAPGVYQFRVAALNTVGKASLWAQSEKELVGLSAVPADVAGFSVRVVSGQAQVLVTASTDLDVRIGGRLIVRLSPLSTGAIWNDGMLLAPDGWPGDSEQVMVPLMGGTYLAKWQDSTGQLSTNAASFTLTEAHMTGFTVLATAAEHPAFTGTKSSVAVVDGGVQLVGATLWDDLGLIDGLDYIDSAGGIVPAGTYTFTNRIDLGSVLTVRLFPNVKSQGFDTGDFWDSRTSPIDSWGLVDGSVIEDAEVALEVRSTSDNPAGSPTWGPWHALPGQADYTARAFEFRAQFTSANVTHNRKATELSVVAKQPT